MKKIKKLGKEFITELSETESRALNASDLADILIKKGLLKEEDIILE